ncbi:putative 2OG-Fe(II) oxygenase [Rubrivivax sp. RP6-9]|uniref:putative 2OG-Fe(II) oxygenase n=1 Tax=Rubrivivax sp. RP6-9 TaxID=3415750 RepID=UPI003CC5CB91
MSLQPGFHTLWPTPLAVRQHGDADALNALLVRVFGALRVTQSHARGAAPGAFFASDDDLLQRVQLPEWQGFVRFVVERLRDTVQQANAAAWPAHALQLQVHIAGMWFQVGNGGAFHDVHTHGNCSWSGVYCVQVDAEAERTAHPVYGAANGVTRFYGPPFAQLGGAHVDMGNAYLQPPHVDVAPVPGQLVLFPSWLPHQALPYQGTLDRIIVSFNASIHAAQGGDRLHGYSAA